MIHRRKHLEEDPSGARDALNSIKRPQHVCKAYNNCKKLKFQDADWMWRLIGTHTFNFKQIKNTNFLTNYNEAGSDNILQDLHLYNSSSYF